MASATLSALAGSLLSPLSKVSLEKLIGHLWDYISSSPSPSSPDEAEKQQQLKDSLEALEDAKLTVRLMQSRIMKLFQKHKQNERVVGLHNKLKDVGYDIQDLESELMYMELERKVEEINKADQEADNTTTTQSSRGGLKRLIPFRRPTSSSSEKKRRLMTSSLSLSLSTDDDIVTKVASIIKQINSIESKLKDEIKLEEWFDQITLNGVYDPREQHHFTQNKRVTTSSTNERKIYGRTDEIQLLIEFLKKPNVNGNISVASIVGMGGIGKTTLAQFVFNNRKIENYFNKKAWICVSNHFDRFKITKEMVDSFCIGTTISSTIPCESTTSLDLLERELKRHLTGKKFLLVMDDIWSDEWQGLLAPLQSAQAHAIKIIVTCRDPTILRSIDQRNKIILEGIDDREYWSFFLNCAFVETNPDNYSQKLHDTGRRIVRKLMGSPLAAKTVGKLLGRDPTEKYWNDVLENDLWKLKTDTHDIMPALALSYYHLPQHLQLCFAFCSLFPKNHFFDMNDLIYMWIANGYVPESGNSSKTRYDLGEEYCHELVAMCFLDLRFEREVKMHDLMHDLAKIVSHGEICTYKSRSDNIISKNVRHLYAQGLIDLGLVCETGNLRTLVFESVDDMFALFIHGAFKRIRMLVISNDNLQEFPNPICHLKHLQYLDLLRTSIKSIPESLCGLYQLKVLKLPCPQTLPSQFHNLINLENIVLMYQSNTFRGSMVLEYHVKRERGFTVAQLRNMNELRGALVILGLENINNMKEAIKAKLKEKHLIKKLKLCWKDRLDGCEHDVQEEVLEGLEPHPNLTNLEIEEYMGSKTPSWLMKLEKLKGMCLSNCRNLSCLPEVGLLHSLTQLELRGANIKTFPTNVIATQHALEDLSLTFCNELLSVEGLQALPSLKSLAIYECPKFRSWCTEEPTNMGYISISSCQNLESLPDWLHRLPSLWGLYISDCSKVNSLPNGGLPSSLSLLSIIQCDPGLIERCQQEGSSEWLMIQDIPDRHYSY